MKRLNIICMTSLLSALISPVSNAEGIDFSLGGGYPFYLTPEISYGTNENNYRWYANYKKGDLDGVSIGVERGYGAGNKHALGMLIGTIGLKDSNSYKIISANDGIVQVNNVNDKTQGVGLSYSYNFNGLNNTGLRVRFVIGYGEGEKSNDKAVDGGVNISYQF